MDKDIPKLLASRYAQFVDNREFDRMREIIARDFTPAGP